jgi:hypothetical protein
VCIGGCFPGGKGQECEADHSPPYTTNINIYYNNINIIIKYYYLYFPIRFYGVLLLAQDCLFALPMGGSKIGNKALLKFYYKIT